MAFKKIIVRRMYTPSTYTLKKHQNTHGYIYILQNVNESKWILNKRIKAIPTIYLMIKIGIGQSVNIFTIKTILYVQYYFEIWHHTVEFGRNNDVIITQNIFLFCQNVFT